MSIFRKRQDDDTAGRDMTREAFHKAMASGRSPGAASLLAEVERGWSRADGRSEDAAGPQGHRARPDAFEPAPLDWYVAWLRGYLRAGGQITHVYDYPYSRVRFVLAARDFTTGGECGASARNILVPAGIRHLGGARGHCNLYFEKRHTLEGNLVPAYSDPAFAALPGYREAATKARADHAESEKRHREYEAQRTRRARTSDLSAYTQDGER